MTTAASGESRLPPAFRAHARARLERWREIDDTQIAPGMEWHRPDRMKQAGARRPLARDFRAAQPSADAPFGPPDTLRVAFIRIDFLNDRGGEQSTGNGRFDLTATDTTVAPIDRAPHNRSFYESHAEALRRYYDAQTYGRTVVLGEVWPRSQNGAYSLGDMADLGPWEFSTDIYRAAVNMFRAMVIAADSQSVVLGDRIPWDRYLHFGSPQIVLIHAGSDLQSDLLRNSPEDIPSFTIGVVDTDAVVIRDVPAPGDSVVVDRGTLVPETINQDGYYGTINGVLAHECGHLFFGFSDIYDVNSGFPVAGLWTLMDSGNLVGSVVQLSNGDEIFATGLLPPSVDPLQRFFATDALDLVDVTYGDTITIQNSERNPDVRRIRLSSDEDLLIENRWITPDDTLQLDQDPANRVILGPLAPDSLDYDALIPGSGALVWHVDSSVIPFTNSLRTNPDFGFNSNPLRQGLSIIEADGLDDLGDPNSPFLLGSYRDPWYIGNNEVLSDTTRPRLVTHTGTRPHTRIEFRSEAGPAMRLSVVRTWLAKGWPVLSSFPNGGPALLAIDADGSAGLEVCWAGGDSAVGDTASLFAVKFDGTGISGGDPVFATLDTRPLREMAAIVTGNSVTGQGPSLFAVSTRASGPDLSTPGGRVWLLDHLGQPAGAWPAALPSLVTTPPVIAGSYPNANVFVGCADGLVYALRLDGSMRAVTSAPLSGGVRGRLAVTAAPGVPGTDGLASSGWAVAAGGGAGQVGVFFIAVPGSGPDAFTTAAGWPQTALNGSAFAPDFLWLDFDGVGVSDPSGCGAGRAELVVHEADRLWGYCMGGASLPGWGRDIGDTLIAALGAGDPDRDGYPEVLTQNRFAQVGFVNASGFASPGWPRPLSSEGILHEQPDLTFPNPAYAFPTSSAPLAFDPVGDGRSRVVALTATGIVGALDGEGRSPDGWPLASGSGALGSPVAADLDGDGSIELVAPDRLGLLWTYSLPGAGTDPLANPWTMLGGDPGRTSALPAARTPLPPAFTSGPLVRGSLKAYPNPARMKPVSFAFQLTEPAEVEIRILDTSGHEVASFSRSGFASDNLVVWDPGAVPAGLYLARLRFRSGNSERLEIVPVGLLR